MPPDDERKGKAREWTAEEEEAAPEFMEPLVEVGDGTDAPTPGEAGVRRARGARDSLDTALYRERTVVEEVVEQEARPAATRPTRAERRAERERLRLEREVDREIRRRGSRIRSTLAYKTFYDMVCNRVGVIVAGFGVAMILFTISYDWLQGEELVLGPKHMTALILSLTVYFLGMALEGLRILSPECEGLEARALAAQASGNGPDTPSATRREEPTAIPMIPEEALEKLNGNRGGDQ